jgi:hypothetical protein
MRLQRFHVCDTADDVFVASGKEMTMRVPNEQQPTPPLARSLAKFQRITVSKGTKRQKHV